MVTQRRIGGRLRALPALLLLAGACGETVVTPTAVIVEVSADDGVKRQLQRLNLRVRAFEGSDLDCRSPECWPLRHDGPAIEGDSIARWPVRVPIVPVDGDAHRVFEVVVEALVEVNHEDQVLVRQRAVAGFVKGESRTLRLRLEDACAGEGDICQAQACNGPGCEVCRAGLCEQVGSDPWAPDAGTPGGRLPDACDDGDARTSSTACGLNGRGGIVQDCEEGRWVDSDACDDPDACTDGAGPRAGSTRCELGDATGRLQQRCDAGQWLDTKVCVTPPADCAGVADSQQITRVRYETAMVPYGYTCTSETQINTCSDGELSGWSGSYTEAFCYAMPPRDCDGTPHGERARRTRYAQPSVPYGESCVGESQTNLCLDGELQGWSGTYTEDGCRTQGPDDCGETPAGEEASRIRYASATVPYGQSCVSEVQTNACEGGAFLGWTGSYTQQSCVVLPAADCDGVAHGQLATRVRYEQAYVPYGDSCASETQYAVCDDGQLMAFGGSFTELSCTVLPAGDCGDVQSGQRATRIRYASAEVAFGETCDQELQTNLCDNGAFQGWTGSYTFASCSARAPADCGNVPHGQDAVRVRYAAAAVPFGQSCQSEPQQATCYDGALGTWSGTFTEASCTVRPPTDGMVLHMPLDGSAEDLGPGGNDGTIHGASPVQDRFGRAGRALYFDGDAHILAPSLGLPLGDTDRTLTFWLRPDSAGDSCGWSGNAVVAWGTGGCTGETFGAGYCEQSWYFWGGCHDAWPSSTDDAGHRAATPGEWSFVAILLSGTSMTVIIDGLRDTFSRTSVDTVDGPLVIGATSTNGGGSFASYFEGAVDDIRIFDRALSDAEIDAIADAP